MDRYWKEHDSDAVSLVGIDAGESHRAKERDRVRYPLVEGGITRADCVKIIRAAGLCVPVKSGCWHCPFARKREVLDLVKNYPDRFLRIVELEEASLDIHPLPPGSFRAQWGDRTAKQWLALARMEERQGQLPIDLGSDPEDMPCGCYDGGGAEPVGSEVHRGESDR